MGIGQDILDNIQRQIDNGTRGTCPVCGRIFGIYHPKGGDGSARKMRRHVREVGAGTLRTERCPGSGRFAKEWE